MRLPLLALPLFSIALSAASHAAEPLLDEASRRNAEQLRETARRGTGAVDIVRSLVVEAGPRPAGSPGDRAAVAWAVRTMERLGFRNVRQQAVSVPVWERGRAEGWIAGPYPQRLEVVALGGSVGTGDHAIEAEVVAFPDLAALEQAAAEQVKGRIVYLGTRMERSRSGEGYGKVVVNRGRGASAAARLGAVGLLIRSVGTSTPRFGHTGGLRYAEEAPKIPAAALPNVDADVLEAQLQSGAPVRVGVFLGCHDAGTAESANVIGEIPGRELPGEVVVLGAHLDSWDLGHGAVDDGAGVAVVLTAARLIGALPQAPRRTLRVVLFANEEHGLSGGRAYALAEGAAGAAQHQVAMESDLGSGAIWRFDSRFAPADGDVADLLQALLAPLGVERGSAAGGGGADISPLDPFGVPFLGLAPDASRYFDVHHTADDTMAQIVPTDLAQQVAAFTVAAYVAAETPRRFARRPPADPAKH